MSSRGFIPVKRRAGRRKPASKQDTEHEQNFFETQGWFQEELDFSGWTTPETPVDVKLWERQGRADRARYFVPYWMQGVFDAENGREPAKMEIFYDKYSDEPSWDSGWGGKVDEDAWRMDAAYNAWHEPPPAEQPQWGKPDPWTPEAGVGHWGSRSASSPSEGRGNSDHTAGAGLSKQNPTMPARNIAILPPDKPDAFIEQVARLQGVPPSRKRSMQRFYDVCPVIYAPI